MSKFVAIVSANKSKLGVVMLMVIAGVVFVSEYDEQIERIETYLPIENIAIEGKFENLVQGEVENTVKSVLHGGYFTVDINGIQQALMRLPWVEEVSIRRQWPAGLNISVIEKQAIAYWGKDRLLSSKGELFLPDSVNHESTMPYLDGPDNLHKSVWVFLQETNQKVKNLDVVVKRLVLDKRRSWEMQLSNNVVIRLGREDTDNRLQRFIKVFNLGNAPKMQHIESIDLRYPNGFAMRMKNTKTVSPKSTLVKKGLNHDKKNR